MCSHEINQQWESVGYTLKLDGDEGETVRIFCYSNSFLPGDGLGFSDFDRA